ncbi:MAG: ABC transporter ATP-binding protein [Desulfofustis sp.]|nr:ABC transporter ATP-binding protein [Desulfofustis sp.]
MADYILQVKNLCKSFGAVEASRDLCLNVERGHIHALIGPNGAGKTTVLNLLSGELKPDSGTILLNGDKLDGLPAHKRALAGLGRSFQITSIFENLSVSENMALAILAGEGHNYRFWRNSMKAEAVQKSLADALARVDLIASSSQLAANLSHGEKRQLEVGMALVGGPQLLMLDEPMAGQGAGGTVELKKLIRSLKGQTTILLVEHDMDVVFSLADQISVIVYGYCIASGSPEQIRRHPDVQHAYLGEQ